MKSESQEGAEADRRTQHGWFWSDLFGGSLALILALALLLGQGCDKPPRGSRLRFLLGSGGDLTLEALPF